MGLPGSVTRNPNRGVELGYAEITSNFTSTVVAGADVTGLSVTVTVGSRPIEIEVWSAQVTHSANTATTGIRIMEGSTILNIGNLYLPALGKGPAGIAKARLNPTAGSHTYFVRLVCDVAGTMTLVGATVAPAYIRVTEG